MSRSKESDRLSKQTPRGGKTATVLSTKKLTSGQRELLLNRGIGLVEANFIKVQPIGFQIKQLPENIIFTSKNAVFALLEHPLEKEIREKKIFCVGEKTAAFLESNGFRVSKMANYGADLASEIISNHKNDEFLFFCGKKRHTELPERLTSAGINFTEVEVYDTQTQPKKIDRIFDGVLFFSPSAVRSYGSLNDLRGSIAFCIGTTTASEAKNYTNNIIIASTPSIENVLVQVVKTFT
ncbi:uroporphyrinogen-III synthase [Salinimicrobium oceani]|uniref:Uroporphyrinogen-III synthase n=1 Tax=Salinimicrobium oceani TaxID=2722702 RepID=A0ABX1CYZ2_9FLAO|nr:uroporphyrinogen-III synthase [Salinimicrobium oceani]NJW52063.1 uroporphyrinogen-III synthase [Salinimicrobium oceani]